VSPSAGTTVEIDGRQLSLSNLDKVLYPASGFTKGEVIDYYARIAPVMLAHLADRCVTFHRFPNGVDESSFFEKRCPGHRPEWVRTAIGPGDRGGRQRFQPVAPKADTPGIDYCVLDDVASMVWAANLAALELHTPMARADRIGHPAMVVFDLDPGAPAAMQECAEVALLLRDALEPLGLEVLAKTSGSKGLQLYLPINTPDDTPLVDRPDHEHARAFALAVGQVLEKHHPTLVLTQMTKAQRVGRVFIDWSQNAVYKTTICAYSLRARPQPTVSTPVTWDEVEQAADGTPLSFEASDVLERVIEQGDLFAAAATLVQTLPSSG
jgi:bifunctional non-homologous end joining protein LigD